MHCVREGCTAVVEVQQASTDICSFFNQAYVLSAGEVVYHGGANEEAMAMLGGSGMPCPPLYHPIEQYMRLIDPSFEVSMTVHLCTNLQPTLSTCSLNPSVDPSVDVSTPQAGNSFLPSLAALPLCIQCFVMLVKSADSFALHACVAVSIVLADRHQH